MPCKHFKDHFCHLSRNRDSTMTSTAVARCLSVYLFVTFGIVSKRLNLSCMCVRVDLPVVSLRLTVNDDAQTTVISEYDKVTFICSSDSSPAVHTWKYA